MHYTRPDAPSSECPARGIPQFDPADRHSGSTNNVNLKLQLLSATVSRFRLARVSFRTRITQDRAAGRIPPEHEPTPDVLEQKSREHPDNEPESTTYDSDKTTLIHPDEHRDEQHRGPCFQIFGPTLNSGPETLVRTQEPTHNSETLV